MNDFAIESNMMAPHDRATTDSIICMPETTILTQNHR